MVLTSATLPLRVNAADTVPLPPFTHQRQERLVLRVGAGSRRARVFLVRPSRTRPMFRGPTGDRRARQPRPEPDEAGHTRESIRTL